MGISDSRMARLFRIAAMKRLGAVGFALLAAPLYLSGTARAAEWSTCNETQRLARSPDSDEVAAHRLFPLPVVRYPHGTDKDDWGLRITVGVDESGRVVCYSGKSSFDKEHTPDNEQQAVIGGIAAWRYTPFTTDGRAVAAVFEERVSEEELPQKHLPLPEVPLDDVQISLERRGCFGDCPIYKIDIHGDGRVIYRGSGYVDVQGEHSYRVPVDDVAKLVGGMAARDIWSLRPVYRARITDSPTHVLVMKLGADTHELEDYVGQLAGMPRAVTDFENDIDKTARSDMWLHLSQETVQHLKAEGFAFDSPAAANILASAVSNGDSHDDDAMLSLIELGAPLTGAEPVRGFRSPRGTLIEEALRHHRYVLIAPLIARGVLNTNGKPDQEKIDAAFRAAIRGGRLALVQKIWDAGGTQAHPSLTFDDAADDAKHSHQKSQVTLLLSRNPYDKDGWQGLEIAKWLAAKGCDIKAPAANGNTLLHTAARADDARFVRALLDQGMNPSTPGEFGLPALGSTGDEDVAIMLLEAGTDLSTMAEAGHHFRQYAVERHWSRVVAWLDAHSRD
jgi:Domain of unknown function (DUF6438)/Ankyrin repeat